MNPTDIHKQPRPKNQRHNAAKRQDMGVLVKSLRAAAGLTQLDLAEADVLGVDVHAFTKECVRHYELEAYFNAIYKPDERTKGLNLV